MSSLGVVIDGVRARRWRWHGAEGELTPEPGDVLEYSDPDGDRPDWWHLVHAATQVRGREPWHLWLVVTRHDFELSDGVLTVPAPVWDAMETAPVIPAVVRRRGRR